MIDLTTNEILDAIRNANIPDKGEQGFSVDELREALGWKWGILRTRAVLKRLVRDGTVEVAPIARQTLAGYVRTTPGYRFRTSKKAK